MNLMLKMDSFRSHGEIFKNRIKLSWGGGLVAGISCLRPTPEIGPCLSSHLVSGDTCPGNNQHLPRGCAAEKTVI